MPPNILTNYFRATIKFKTKYHSQVHNVIIFNYVMICYDIIKSEFKVDN